jgi:hypothetical protein
MDSSPNNNSSGFRDYQSTRGIAPTVPVHVPVLSSPSSSVPVPLAESKFFSSSSPAATVPAKATVGSRSPSAPLGATGHVHGSMSRSNISTPIQIQSDHATTTATHASTPETNIQFKVTTIVNIGC